jgi:peroxygenase
MLWPEDGRMMKEDVRGVFDGSIFYTIAARRAKGMRPGKSGKWVD